MQGFPWSVGDGGVKRVLWSCICVWGTEEVSGLLLRGGRSYEGVTRAIEM